MRLNRDFAALVILLVALLLSACQPAVTPTPVPPTEDNKAIVRRVLDEIWSQGNLSVVDELYASDFVYRNPGLPEKVTTHAGYKEFVAGVRTGLPDWHVTVEDMVAGEDAVVARWTGQATDQTGKQVTMSGVNIYHIAGGKIVDDWTELDTLSLLIQLGAVPPPGQAEANKAIARRYVEEVWNQGNLAVADEVIAADYQDPFADEPGPESIKALVTMSRSAFPDLNWTIEDIMAEGDKVMIRVTVRGTHQGEFLGFPPTGNELVLTEMDIYRIEDGQIVESWTQVDQVAFFEALGYTITPPE